MFLYAFNTFDLLIIFFLRYLRFHDFFMILSLRFGFLMLTGNCMQCWGARAGAWNVGAKHFFWSWSLYQHFLWSRSWSYKIFISSSVEYSKL